MTADSGRRGQSSLVVWAAEVGKFAWDWSLWYPFAPSYLSYSSVTVATGGCVYSGKLPSRPRRSPIHVITATRRRAIGAGGPAGSDSARRAASARLIGPIRPSRPNP